MARKTRTVVIDDKTSRDCGKRYYIEEFPARRAEKWATKALLAMTNAGVDVPPEVVRMGAAAVLAVGMRALLTMGFMEAEPLLDEMMQCVQFVPDPAKPDLTLPLDDYNVEEVATLVKLREEVIDIHTGFSIAAFLSNLGTAASGENSTSPTT